MDKRLVAAGLIVIVAVIGAVVLFYHPQQDNVPVSNVTRPQEGYLPLQGGGISRVYLINSSISYCTFDKDSSFGPDESYSFKMGDPCVIISGTIRNDGKERYVPLSAHIYNRSGESVGMVVNGFSKLWFVTVGVDSNSTRSFTITIKYDKQDVTGYDVFLSWEPTASPPP
jgi:hypothetical protein